MTDTTQSYCPLCDTPGGDWVFNCKKFRVIDALDADYPGFLRLVWNQHVKEFSDLPEQDALLCMHAVVVLEKFVLREFRPDKVNVATLGNVVPHLHWHIIPRFTDDRHFPAPVWANPSKGSTLSARQLPILENKSNWHEALRAELRKHFPE